MMKQMIVVMVGALMLGGCTAKLAKEDMDRIDAAVAKAESAANKAEMAAKSASDAAARAEASSKKVDAIFAKGLHKK